MESSSTDGGDPHQTLTNIASAPVDAGMWVALVMVVVLLLLGLWLLAVAKAMRNMQFDHPQDREKALLSVEMAGSFSLAMALIFFLSYFQSFLGFSFIALALEALVIMFLFVFTNRFLYLRLAQKGTTPPPMLIIIASVCSRLFGPVTSLPTLLANWLFKKTGGVEHGFEILEEAAEVADHSPVTNQEEKNLEESHIRFGDRQVKQIMKPRGDIDALDDDETYLDMMKEVQSAGYSRLPVYHNDMDNVIGVLYVKDLLGHLDKDNEFKWQELVRKPLFVPETIKIDSLLREMKRTRVHIALTVDEYGSTSGLVTLEDIMEEVMGEIRDEYDDGKEFEFEKIDDHSYIFEGKTLLGDVCKVLGLETDTFDEVKGDTDSLAGLVLQLEDRIPEVGEETTYQNFQFKIEALGMNRIEKIRVTIQDEVPEEKE